MYILFLSGTGKLSRETGAPVLSGAGDKELEEDGEVLSSKKGQGDRGEGVLNWVTTTQL